MLHAVGDMVAQDFLFQAPQRGADRGNLGHDVDAIAILLDHAGNAANLSLDAIEPLRTGLLDILSHAPYIPPTGIRFNTAHSEHGDAHIQQAGARRLSFRTD